MPIDEVERIVAIPFYLAAQNATPGHERFLRVRFVIRGLLGLPNDVGNVFLCPVPLRVEPAGQVTFCRHTQCHGSGTSPAIQKGTQRFRFLANFRTFDIPNRQNRWKLLIQIWQ